MNLNEFAKEITLEEGKKVNLPIGQVKEVMQLVFKKLAGMNLIEVLEILKKYRR